MRLPADDPDARDDWWLAGEREGSGKGSQATCPDCGAVASPETYFCRTCSAMLQDPQRFFPPTRPPTPTIEQKVARHAPRVMPIFWAYMGALVGIGVTVELIEGVMPPHVAIVVASAVLLVLTAWFSVRHWEVIAPQLRRTGFGCAGAWVGLAMLPLLLGAGWAWRSFLLAIVDTPPDSFVGPLRAAGMSTGSIIMLISVMPALTEEIAFRGLLQHWLVHATSPRVGITLGAALFTALHFSPLTIPVHMLAGWVFGWVAWRSSSLYPAMLIHGLYNAGVVLVLGEG